MNSPMMRYVLECKSYSSLAERKILRQLNLWNMAVWLYILNRISCIGSVWNCVIEFPLWQPKLGQDTKIYCIHISSATAVCMKEQGGVDEEWELSTILYKHVGDYLLSENYHLTPVLKGINNFVTSLSQVSWCLESVVLNSICSELYIQACLHCKQLWWTEIVSFSGA